MNDKETHAEIAWRVRRAIVAELESADAKGNSFAASALLSLVLEGRLAERALSDGCSSEIGRSALVVAFESLKLLMLREGAPDVGPLFARAQADETTKPADPFTTNRN